VPETVLINGQQRVPTAMNVFFMTSSNDTAADHHKMWLDDTQVFETKEITDVTHIDDIEVAYGTALDKISLPQEVTVTLEDGTEKKLSVVWDDDSYNATEPGEYSFKGTITLPDGIKNTGNHSATLKVIVAKEVHEPKKVEAKEATCTEKGNIEYWHCEVCGLNFADEACKKKITKDETITNAKGHVNIKISNKHDSTCTSEGYTGDEVCADCDTVLTEGKAIEKINHDYKDGKCRVCESIDETYKPDDSNDSSNESDGTVTTGDNNNIVCLSALMIGCSLISAFIYLKNKKSV
ncbi:MAG: Ig-like domain-containing protein, partial [Coprobacillus sp.]